MHMTALSEAIKTARGKRRAIEFAAAVGTNLVTLRDWESGLRSPVLYRHVEALAAEGVDMELLRAGAARRVAA